MSVEQDLLLNVMLSTHSQPFHGIYVVRQTLLFLPLAHSRGTTALFFRLLFYYTMTAAKTTTKLVKKKEKNQNILMNIKKVMTKRLRSHVSRSSACRVSR